MAEQGMTSFKSRYLAFRARHARHLEKAGKATMTAGRAVVGGGAAFVSGVANHKFGKDEAGYENLRLAKIGPVPASLLVGALAVGAGLWGIDEQWGPWAESAGLGPLFDYAGVMGRRMTIDWEAKKASAGGQ